MTRPAALLLVAFACACAGLPACAAAPAPPDADRAPARAVETVEPAPRPEPRTAGADDRFLVEVWIAREGDGATVAVPPVTVDAFERAETHLVRPVSYVRDVDVVFRARSRRGEVVPVRALACPGVHVEFALAGGGAMDADTVAVAFCVASSALDQPIAARTLRTGLEPSAVATVSLPRAETIEYVGARRARLGAVLDLATLPSYDGEKTVRIRATRASGRASGPDWKRCLDGDLRSLLECARRGDVERRTTVETHWEDRGQPLCGTVSGPLQAAGFSETPTFDAPCLAFTSVVGPGFAMAQRIETSYVGSYDLDGSLADPAIAVHTSELALTAREFLCDVTPEFVPGLRRLAPGFDVVVDLPVGGMPGRADRRDPFEPEATFRAWRPVLRECLVARVTTTPLR